ncbi:MAG: site-specific integrase, partial [Lentisphaeria bacterium]|nr:site-specific integrase [Lentisphaeria bacterium]
MPYLKEFLEYVLLERGLARKTVDAYRNDLVLFGDFLEKNSIADVNEITRDTIRAFLAAEQERGMA